MIAEELLPGFTFDWCGRSVRVVSTEPSPRYSRSNRDPGLHITVDIGGGEIHRLHYWRHERVYTSIIHRDPQVPLSAERIESIKRGIAEAHAGKTTPASAVIGKLRESHPAS